MNIADSTALMEKINSLIIAAEEYGNQSAQLTKAKHTLEESFEQFSNSNSALKELTILCTQYLDETKQIIERDFTTELKAKTDEAERLVENVKNQCQSLSDEYEAILQDFKVKKDLLEEHQNSIAATVDSGISKLTTQIDVQTDTIAKECQGATEDIKKATNAVAERIAADTSAYTDLVCEKINGCISAIQQNAQSKANEITALLTESSQKNEKTVHSAVQVISDSNTTTFNELSKKIGESLNNCNTQISAAVATIEQRNNDALDKSNSIIDNAKKTIINSTDKAREDILEIDGQLLSQVNQLSSALTALVNQLVEDVRAYTVNVGKGLDENRIQDVNNAREIRERLTEKSDELSSRTTRLENIVSAQSTEIASLKGEINNLKNADLKNKSILIAGTIAAFISAAGVIVGFFL